MSKDGRLSQCGRMVGPVVVLASPGSLSKYPDLPWVQGRSFLHGSWVLERKDSGGVEGRKYTTKVGH